MEIENETTKKCALQSIQACFSHLHVSTDSRLPPISKVGALGLGVGVVFRTIPLPLGSESFRGEPLPLIPAEDEV